MPINNSRELDSDTYMLLLIIDTEFKILEPNMLVLRRGPFLVVSSKESAERPGRGKI